MKDSDLGIAASTLKDMCDDYLSGGITDGTFVSNLRMYAEQCAGTLRQDPVHCPQCQSSHVAWLTSSMLKCETCGARWGA